MGNVPYPFLKGKKAFSSDVIFVVEGHNAVLSTATSGGRKAFGNGPRPDALEFGSAEFTAHSIHDNSRMQNTVRRGNLRKLGDPKAN